MQQQQGQQQEQKMAVLEHTFLFRGLTAQERQTLTAGWPLPERFRRGEQVYSRHRFRRALGILLDGSLRVLGGEENGRRVVVNRLKPGDVFGAAALYGDGDAYVTDIEAVQPCTVLFVPQECMTALMRQDVRVAENYVRFLTDRICFLNRRITGFTGGDAAEKLLGYLREHCGPDGHVTLPHSRSELAQILNIGRSSLYRSLDALTAEGHIRQEGGEIFMESNKLNKG